MSEDNQFLTSAAMDAIDLIVNHWREALEDKAFEVAWRERRNTITSRDVVAAAPYVSNLLPDGVQDER